MTNQCKSQKKKKKRRNRGKKNEKSLKLRGTGKVTEEAPLEGGKGNSHSAVVLVHAVKTARKAAIGVMTLVSLKWTILRGMNIIFVAVKKTVVT